MLGERAGEDCSETDRQTDRETDGRTNGGTDRGTQRQRETDRDNEGNLNSLQSSRDLGGDCDRSVAALPLSLSDSDILRLGPVVWRAVLLNHKERHRRVL